MERSPAGKVRRLCMLSLWRAPLRARPPLGCVRCGCVGGYGAPSSWCRRVPPTGGSDGRPGGVHAKHTSVTMGRTPQTCGYTSTEKATRRTDGRAVSSGRDAEEDGGMRGDHPDRRGVTTGIGISFLALSRPTPMAGAIPARLPVAATWAPLLTPRPRLVPPSPATLPSDRWLSPAAATAGALGSIPPPPPPHPFLLLLTLLLLLLLGNLPTSTNLQSSSCCAVLGTLLCRPSSTVSRRSAFPPCPSPPSIIVMHNPNAVL